MKKPNIIILTISCILIFTLIYSIHFDYRFPYHLDEWNHISFSNSFPSINHLELGFHFFLKCLSYFTNLVLIYKFLPAIWGVLSALALFYIVYKKSDKFWIAIFSIIFLASIKSNLNILGFWFFTPLTFSIPFIFLYIYFFNEGFLRRKKSYIILSLLIMIFLIPIHAVSVLFSIPFLIIYSLINYKYLKEEYKFFLFFLLIPLIGLIFYKYVMQLSIGNLFSNIFQNLQFKKGWGIIERNITFTEIYNLIGYLLALLGAFILILKRKREYYIYLLWPLTILISVFIFKITDISYLAPYQRNMYYFALSLPILSAFGLYYLIILIKNSIKDITLKRILIIILLIFVLILTFKSYYYAPENTTPYQFINEDNYQAILFLSNYPKGITLAEDLVSITVNPISNQPSLIKMHEFQKRYDALIFYKESECENKSNFIDKYNITYVISSSKINCNWSEIYNKNNYIYKID